MNEKLISQFQDKTILGALLESLAEEMAEILQAFDDLANKRWIDTGEGKQLDGIGEIVGRDRLIANAIALPFFGFVDQPAALGFNIEFAVGAAEGQLPCGTADSHAQQE